MRLRDYLEARKKVDLFTSAHSVTDMSAQSDKQQSEAALREADAIKAEFRREDRALVRAGRAREVLAKNVAALGIDPNERLELVTINGVRIR